MFEMIELSERESMEFDVVIVGAGPAGLAAAIRLKQVNPELSVVVLEKGAEVGAHILSGAVVDPIGIDRLLPGWREEADHPFKTELKDDHFLFLGPAGSIRLPNFLMPPLMNNHGNYIVSLGNVCRWLASHAEALGVEIYPGFAATEVLYNDEGAVIGVATGDMGIERNGEPGPNFARGMALLGKYTLIGEGVRGSLAKQLIAKFDLSRDRDVQKFGIGLKELWQVKPENHKPGLVQHSFGWPLGMKTGGGSFLYHLEDNMVAVGFVVHLNYKNPYLYPFEEFQRFKTHPAIRGTFEGGKRLSYGARAITEGGYQSVPKLSFPGGALIGCSAGLVNVPRIKGSHNAVLSGILAAEKLAAAIEAGRANDEPIEIERGWRDSAIGQDLKRVRNVKPLWSKFGTAIGVALGGLDMWTNQLFGFSFFGTLKHGKTDAACLEPAAQHQKI
ncbi:NAD(P)/FAD-dependent oxidoreductase, partial [Ensifer sp. LC499]